MSASKTPSPTNVSLMSGMACWYEHEPLDFHSACLSSTPQNVFVNSKNMFLLLLYMPPSKVLELAHVKL